MKKERSKRGPLPQDSDARWLRKKRRPAGSPGARRVRIADLYCGCGGMSLGVSEALREQGVTLEVALAVDIDPSALDVYELNFPDATTRCEDLGRVFGSFYGESLTVDELALRDAAGKVDWIVSGPPCQGHSDLNNRTRRRDPKNELFRTVARAAEVLAPDIVVIENVPPVENDARGVVSTTIAHLERLGYSVGSAVVNASRLGVPQERKRFILVASRVEGFEPEAFLQTLLNQSRSVRDVQWALADLMLRESESTFDTPSRVSADNQRRIEYLFENDLYDLPDSERPPCHRHGNHTYRAVYGRLRWDQPAKTITTGFTSMGQGRFVHPSRRRTLTPHEAARLQTFPDWFDWGASSRTTLTMLIGNAVPPLLMKRLAEALAELVLNSDAEKTA